MKQLNIYFTSDIHGYFFPTTYEDDKISQMGLFSCMNQCSKDENTLILDGGDILQGSAFASYCHEKEKSPRIIADILNSCGYDFVTIGNHDFNYGTDYLRSFYQQLNAVCVCQNVLDANGNVLFPYQIITMKNGLRVGIMGIVTDFVNVWETKENIADMQITSPLEAAKKNFLELKEQSDVTICIYHGGFERNLESEELLSENSENIACKICETLDFDVLLTGHQHMHVAGRYYHGTYILQPRENGSECYKIKIEVEKNIEKETYQISSILSEEIKAYAKKDTLQQTKFLSVQSKVQSWLDIEIGVLKENLFPKEKLEMALNGSALADFLNEVQVFYSGAQISAVSLANEVAGIPKQVTRRNVLTSYPYPNTLLVLEITGESLKAAIERSCEYFSLDIAGKPAISEKFLNPKIEHYNYDYFLGVTFERDLKNEPGNRVKNLCYKGKDVRPEDTFTICVNNYRASGAGGYPMYPKCRIVKELHAEMSKLIIDYIKTHSTKDETEIKT